MNGSAVLQLLIFVEVLHYNNQSQKMTIDMSIFLISRGFSTLFYIKKIVGKLSKGGF